MAQRQRRDERWITVVETREFQQRAATRMSDTERQNFITFIAGHPEDGVIMVGTGGIRKSRYHNPTMPVFLLTVFAKNERDNLSQRDRNILKHVVTEIVSSWSDRVGVFDACAWLAVVSTPTASTSTLCRSTTACGAPRTSSMTPRRST